MTTSCPDPTAPSATGSATAPGVCAASLTIGSADVEIPGACPQEKTIQRTWTAADDDGNDSSCVQTVTVDDATAPTVTCGVAVDTLWPANHKWNDIGFTYETSDDCDADPDVVITVSSDEHPAQVTGAGWVVTIEATSMRKGSHGASGGQGPVFSGPSLPRRPPS